MEPGYMKVSEVAKRCDVTPWTVYRWIRFGLIEVIRLPSGTIKIPVEEAKKIVSQMGRKE